MHELEDNISQNTSSVRPDSLSGYIGQDDVKSQMALFIEAAKKRHDALDHCLIYGPPGLGKTTLANVIANQMESGIKQTSGPVLERLKNTIGLNDSYTDKPNGLGAGALGLIGGAVKETKEVYGDGGPISEKTLDLAIEASKELFYELDPSYILKPTGNVFEDYLSKKEADAKLEKEEEAAQDAKDAKDAAKREENKNLTENELLEKQNYKLKKFNWGGDGKDVNHINHHLYKVMERNFNDDSDLRKYVFNIDKDGDEVSQLGNKYAGDIDFNDKLELPPLKKYKDEVFLEIAIGNANELKSRVSDDKLELLNVIVKKITDLKSKNEDNYHKLVSMLAEPGKYGLGVICPLGNVFLENTKPVSDIVNELVATGALHEEDQQAILTQQKPKGGDRKNQTESIADLREDNAINLV